MFFFSKELSAIISIALSVVSAYPYIRDCLRGTTKPHFFTWCIWCLSASIIFYALYINGAGPGAWVTGFFAVKCFVYCVLAYFVGERQITRSDWGCFIGALLAIPLWRMTNDPLWSVIWLIGIEAIAFIPTFRKSWLKPHEETLQSYLWAIIQCFLALLATERFIWVNTLYAVSIIIQNTVFILFVLWRRKKL